MPAVDMQQPTFDDLELLAEVSQLLTLLDLDRVLERVIQLAARAVGATNRPSLFLYHEFEVDWAHIFVTRDLRPDESINVVRSVLDRGLAGWVFRNRQGTIVRDTATDERWIHFPDDTQVVGSALCVPLVNEGQVIAVVTMTHAERAHFNDYHLRLMTIIANQATVAVRNAQLFSRLQMQQRQLETVLHAVPDILLVLDDRGYILKVNDAALGFLGEDDPENVLRRHLSEFLETSGTLLPVLQIVQDLARDQKHWSFEVRSERRQKDYQVMISLWRDVQHGLVGYVVSMHDVTTLRDLTRFKDEMLRIASHDLRSPLSLIIGYAEILSMDIPPDSHQQEFVDAIRRSSERMNGLLDDLLRVEQVRRSPLELHQRVDLTGLVDTVLEHARPLAQRRGHRLLTEVDLHGAPLAVVDPALMRRAMENLVTNAVKYTPEGGGQIIVRAAYREGRFFFEVQDNGIGIPEEHVGRVFESFYRVKDERINNVSGFGLGLSLVRTIVERHRGEVWVDSKVGTGSTFGFFIPLQ